MKNNYSELFKNTSILTIANFSSKVLVFLLVPLYTKTLTTEEYGFIDLVFVTIQLLVPILTLNITDSILRFSLEKSNSKHSIYEISLKYIFASIIPAVIITLIFDKVGYFANRIHWIFIVIYYFSYTLNQFYPAFAKGIDKVKDMAVAGVIGTIVTLLSCIILLLVVRIGLLGYVISSSLGQLVPAIYLAFKVTAPKTDKEKDSYKHSLEIRMIKFSVPLIMTNIGWWVNSFSDRFIITKILGAGENGLLSVAYKIPNILSVVFGIFIQAWQISAFKEYGKENSNSFYNSVFRYSNIFIYYAAFGLIILTRPIARLFFQNDFYGAWVFVPFLLISSVFTANAGLFAPIISSSYNTKDVALSAFFGGMINIVLNIVLLKAIGAQGVAIATAISSFFILFFRYNALHGVIEKPLFLKTFFLWILLIAQCVTELNGWWFIEPVFLIIASLFLKKDLAFIVGQGLAALKSRKN